MTGVYPPAKTADPPPIDRNDSPTAKTLLPGTWLTLREAADTLGRRPDGSPIVSPAQLAEWVRVGLTVPTTGKQVFLPARRFGRAWYVEIEDLRRFVVATMQVSQPSAAVAEVA